MRCRRGHRTAHLGEHLLGERQVEQRVDEQGGVAVDDEARVAPSPAAVGLEVGVEAVADLLQPFAVAPRHLALTLHRWRRRSG